jgi:succinate dehydrogenase / fumarate reductase cytochrome b subunit
MPPTERPLSPHLQIYRLQITSVLSILHRITGVALTLGTLLLTWWLVSAAYGPDAFANAQAFVGSWFGQLLLWGFTFALFYHLGNGIRHLAWDFGWGFELPQLRASGVAMLAFAVAGSLFTLIAAYATRG